MKYLALIAFFLNIYFLAPLAFGEEIQIQVINQPSPACQYITSNGGTQGWVKGIYYNCDVEIYAKPSIMTLIGSFAGSLMDKDYTRGFLNNKPSDNL